MTFASSSVKVLLRKIFFTRKVFPEGRIAPVVGMGGSPSFCCRLSAMTRNTLRPMFILFREKSFKVKMSDNSSFFMLKTSHQITVRDGRKRDRRKMNLSVQHFLNQPRHWNLTSNSQVPLSHFWGQLALLFSSLLQNPPIPSWALLPRHFTFPSMSRWLVSRIIVKNHQCPSASHYKAHWSIYICTFSSSPLLLLQSSGADIPSYYTESYLLLHYREITLSNHSFSFAPSTFPF